MDFFLMSASVNVGPLGTGVRMGLGLFSGSAPVEVPPAAFEALTRTILIATVVSFALVLAAIVASATGSGKRRAAGVLALGCTAIAILAFATYDFSVRMPGAWNAAMDYPIAGFWGSRGESVPLFGHLGVSWGAGMGWFTAWFAVLFFILGTIAATVELRKPYVVTRPVPAMTVVGSAPWALGPTTPSWVPPPPSCRRCGGAFVLNARYCHGCGGERADLPGPPAPAAAASAAGTSG